MSVLLLKQPFQAALDSAESILIAGDTGGGFDIFCGLPLYFALLKKQGKHVHLATFSFSNI